MALKLDLHVHTCYSHDASTTLKEVLTYSKKRGLDGVAITDHDTVEGALRLVKRNEIIVIPGVEVGTLRGHVLGLNITRPIPYGLGLYETIELIHCAGGIAVAAHPNVFYRGLKGRLTSNFDAIEGINSSAFPFFLSTHISRKLAFQLNLPQTGGSDAHYAHEIGYAYTMINADQEVDEIVQAIEKGATIPFGEPLPWKLRLRREALKLKKRL